MLYVHCMVCALCVLANAATGCDVARRMLDQHSVRTVLCVLCFEVVRVKLGEGQCYVCYVLG